MTHTVLYDDECNFCKVVMDAILSWDGRRGALRPVPIQSDTGRRLLADVPVQRHLESFHVVRPDGSVLSAGPALALLTQLLPGGTLPGLLLRAAPGPTAAGYRWVARHRIAISRYVPARLKRRATRRLHSYA